MMGFTLKKGIMGAGILLMGALAFASGSKEEDVTIKGVTAITEVLGDGQKVAAVVLQYGTDIDGASLNVSDFSVTDQEVQAVYASGSAVTGRAADKGPFVIVELKQAVVPKLDGPGNHAPGEGGPGQDGAGGPPPRAGGPGELGVPVEDSPEPVILTAEVSQTGDIATAKGTVIPGSDAAMMSDTTVNPIVDDFQQFVFEDPAYGGKSLMYNLYIPENYDPAKVYPLVLFIHDAGVVSNNPIATLTQGLGAVAWASPEVQAMEECFVLAPQYSCVIVGDSTAAEEVDMTADLVNYVADQYSIDRDRMYNTGQSMGGMTAIAMDIKYPELFAASWLVACQWDPAVVSPMADKPLWIVVSEGDNKAYPGMEAITAELMKYGATVTRDGWDAQSDLAGQEARVAAMRESDTTIHYTVFDGDTHRYTWQYAYYIDGIKDWLFEQRK